MVGERAESPHNLLRLALLVISEFLRQDVGARGARGLQRVGFVGPCRRREPPLSLFFCPAALLAFACLFARGRRGGRRKALEELE